MGNLCGKEKSDNFSTPGRPVGGSSAEEQGQQQQKSGRAQVPSRATKPSANSPGRPLGGGGGGGGAAANEDARAAAARAAESRASAKPKGEMGKKLDAQKRQTRTDTLEEASRENRRARELDGAADVRNYD